MVEKHSKIKCLFIVPSLMRGGAETQAIDLINGIDSNQFEKHLLVFEKAIDQRDRVDQKLVKFHHCVRKSKFDLTFIKEIAQVIDDNEIDVVHCTLQISLLFAWLAKKMSRTSPRLIVAIHTTINVSQKNEWLDMFIYRRLIKSCEKIIFVCQTQADVWAKKYPEIKSKSVVVYNGVNTTYFNREDFVQQGLELRKSLNISIKDQVITCIAGFRVEKGHKYLFDAFLKLPSHVHLILAGDGLLKKDMEDYVSSIRLSDRVHFLGNVSDVRPVLAASNVSVLTSTAVETFSIAMLESMSMQVPFVSTDIGGLKEAVEEGETGYIVPVGDIDAISNALSTCLNNEENLIQMGVKSRERVEKLFSEELMVNNTQIIL